jgi:hypothetical protein
MREGLTNGTVPIANLDLGVLYVEDMGGFGMRHFNKAGKKSHILAHISFFQDLIWFKCCLESIKIIILKCYVK